MASITRSASLTADSVSVVMVTRASESEINLLAASASSWLVENNHK